MRETLKRVCPQPILRTLRILRNIVLPGKVRQKVFTDIYSANHWNDDQSVSGSGSNVEQTETIRREIPRLLKEVDCKTLLDSPCGDFYWMNLTDLGEVDYTGADIVPDLVERNNSTYSSPKKRFIVADISQSDLPKVDVILCRDCLVHLSYQEILAAVRNFKRSGSIYLLTTHFTDRTENKDIMTGDWRPLNLSLKPFLFPEPVALINEACTELNGQYADKCLALWRLEELPG